MALKQLIKDREALQSRLDVLNDRIVESVKWSKTEPLYEISSDAESFKNDNVFDLHIVNSSFFRINHKGYGFSDVNMKPETFKRFIVACIELYDHHEKNTKKESKAAKLRIEKCKIQKKIDTLK